MNAMLGDLPTWNLADLYSSPTGPDLLADLKRADAEAEALPDERMPDHPSPDVDAGPRDDAAAVHIAELREAAFEARIGAAAAAPACNGWTFWHIERMGKIVPIDSLRDRVRAEMAERAAAD